MESKKSDILQIFKNLDNIVTKPAQSVNNIVFYAIILLVILSTFQTEIFNRLTIGIDRTSTLLTFPIFIISGTLKLLFQTKEDVSKRFNELNNVIANGSVTQHAQEVDAIAIFPKIIENIELKRIDIIQISGQNIVDLVARLCKEKTRCKFRILLLDPVLANSRFVNQRFDLHVSRLSATTNQIESKNLNERVEIRFYKSEPGVCAVIADGRAAILSWYRANFEEDGQVIHGHNSAAVIDNGSESGVLRKFAQLHFTKIWNDSQTYGLDEFKTRVIFGWQYQSAD